MEYKPWWNKDKAADLKFCITFVDKLGLPDNLKDTLSDLLNTFFSKQKLTHSDISDFNDSLIIIANQIPNNAESVDLYGTFQILIVILKGLLRLSIDFEEGFYESIGSAKLMIRFSNYPEDEDILDDLILQYCTVLGYGYDLILDAIDDYIKNHLDQDDYSF